MEKIPKKTKTWVIKCQGDIDTALKIIEDYMKSISHIEDRYARKLKNKEIYNIEQLPCYSKGKKRYIPPEDDDSEDNYYLFSFKGRGTVITRSFFYKIWGDLDIKPAFVYEEKREKGEDGKGKGKRRVDKKEESPKEDEETHEILRKMRKLDEAREKMEKVHEEFNGLFREVMPEAISLLEKMVKEKDIRKRKQSVSVSSTDLWSFGDVKSEEMKSCSEGDLVENSVSFKVEREI